MKRSIISSVVLVLVAGAAGAFVIDPGMPAFSMIGITRGQMAQLNVTAIDNPNTTPPDTGGIVPDNPDRVLRLQFVAGDGSVLKESQVRLRAGQSAALDFTFGETVPDAPDRVQIRAAVFVVPDGPDKNARSTLRIVANVEVIDIESGRTAFVLPGVLPAYGDVNGDKK